MKVGKLTFGVTSVANGVKSSVANAEPALIANSTNGKFTITAPVSKALNIGVGDYVQFFNNHSNILAAIAEENEVVIKFAEDNGIDLSTEEGKDMVVSTFGSWFISKGIQLFDSKGKELKTTKRLSKEEKAEYIAEHTQEVVDSMRDALVERCGDDTLSDEELAKYISIDDISFEENKFSGSKTMTTANAVGVGCQLSFTDSMVWATLKHDLVDKNEVNRVFKVDIEQIDVVEVSNGKEIVKVKVLPIAEYEDKPVTKKTSNKSKSAE